MLSTTLLHIKSSRTTAHSIANIGVKMWFEKYRILLWKNWIIQKRHYKSGIFELVFPVAFVIFFTWNKSLLGRDESSSVNHYESEYQDWRYCSIDRGSITAVYYSPQSPWIEGFLGSVFNSRGDIEIRGFDNADALDRMLGDPGLANEEYIGIEFDDSLRV